MMLKIIMIMILPTLATMIQLPTMLHLRMKITLSSKRRMRLNPCLPPLMSQVATVCLTLFIMSFLLKVELSSAENLFYLFSRSEHNKRPTVCQQRLKTNYLVCHFVTIWHFFMGFTFWNDNNESFRVAGYKTDLIIL